MPKEPVKKAPDPKRSAAAKKAAATRKAQELQRQREEAWKQRIWFVVKTAVGCWLLIRESQQESPDIMLVGAGLSLLGLNVASWLDNMGGKK